MVGILNLSISRITVLTYGKVHFLLNVFTSQWNSVIFYDSSIIQISQRLLERIIFLKQSLLHKKKKITFAYPEAYVSEQ